MTSKRAGFLVAVII